MIFDEPSNAYFRFVLRRLGAELDGGRGRLDAPRGRLRKPRSTGTARVNYTPMAAADV